MDSAKTVYILMPVFNRKAVTLEFCNLLLKQTYTHFLLLLIDDGSTDGTAQAVEQKLGAAVKVLKTSGNCWWAGSLNYGYEWLKTNTNGEGYVLIANDDMTFESQYLEAATTLLTKNSKTLIGSVCYGESSSEAIYGGLYWDWSSGGFRKLEKSEKEKINCLASRGLFMSNKDFLDLGPFYPKILPHYLSDYEHTIRAYNRGYKLMVDATVFVRTKEDSAGYSNFDVTSWNKFFKQYFSPKNYNQPFYKLAFIYLCCPRWTWQVKNYLRTLVGVVRDFKPIVTKYFVGKILFFVLRFVYLFFRKAINFCWRVLHWDFKGIQPLNH